MWSFIPPLPPPDDKLWLFPQALHTTFREKEANTELTENDLKKYENQSAQNHHSSFPVCIVIRF